MQEKALDKACSKYGKVEHVRVLRDKGSAFSNLCPMTSLPAALKCCAPGAVVLAAFDDSPHASLCTCMPCILSVRLQC